MKKIKIENFAINEQEQLFATCLNGKNRISKKSKLNWKYLVNIRFNSDETRINNTYSMCNLHIHQNIQNIKKTKKWWFFNNFCFLIYKQFQALLFIIRKPYRNSRYEIYCSWIIILTRKRVIKMMFFVNWMQNNRKVHP